MPAVAAAHARATTRSSWAQNVPSAAALAAGGGPVVILGFSQGGYPVLVVAAYGVVLWWLLLVGLLTRAIPRPLPTTAGWATLGAVAGLAVWSAISLTWSVDPERGLTEVARLVVAGGSLLLGMSAVRAGRARALAAGVLAGLTVITAAGVLSRLQPDLVPQATETGEFLGSVRNRLSWPLNYWNSMAAAAAIAVPLALALAVRTKTAWASALATATIPVLSLGIAFTLSRGGAGIVAIGLAATLVLIRPRLVTARTMLAPALGSAIILWAALRSDALMDAAGGPAQSDAGLRLALIVLLACVGVALVQAAWVLADRARWTTTIRRPRRQRWVLTGLVLAAGVVVAATAGGTIADRTGDAWTSFKVPTVSQTVADAGSVDRFSSLSGSGRFQVWSGAVRAWEEQPLRGIGLGSWESWWNPQRGTSGFIRNVHSQPLETLASVGMIGFVLFGALIGIPLLVAVGRRRSYGARRWDAHWVAPALVAFVVAVTIDWTWQISAVAVAGMALAAPVLSRRHDGDDAPAASAAGMAGRGGSILKAGGIVAVAAASIAVLGLALVAPVAVTSSQSAMDRGDLRSAAARAAAGQDRVSFAASPAIQEALVHERTGDLDRALSAATVAAQRTPDDWRAWLLISRIQVARDEPARAVAAFRRARALNPHSTILHGK
ncbi:MAG: O-antigen ligase family protein [Patulibacter sp.]